MLICNLWAAGLPPTLASQEESHPSSGIVSNLLHVKTSHPPDKLDETQEVPETDRACYAPPSTSFYKQ